MTTTHQYSLRWSNYFRHMSYAFDSLRSQDDFVDVTLSCDGKKIRAHKVLLSACSGYFKEVFKENPCPHPVIIFKFIKYEDLLAIIEFMYQGEVNVQQDALQSFLQTAELLAVQGLTSEEREKPKTQKEVDQEILEDQIVKTLPATIRAVTENNTQTSTVEIQANVIHNSSIAKKRKIPFNEEEVYTETVEFSKEEPTIVKGKLFFCLYKGVKDNLLNLLESVEVQYIPATMKMDIPEYIDVAEANQLSETDGQQVQQGSQDTTTQTNAQFTSEYEILTEQTAYESEVEEKYDQQDNAENNEITTVEMGRLFTTQNSAKTGSNEKLNSTQDVPNGKWTECQFCKMVITTVNLWRHIRTQHTPQPPRKCELCQKNFKNKYSLREHIRISHEQKLFKSQPQI